MTGLPTRPSNLEPFYLDLYLLHSDSVICKGTLMGENHSGFATARGNLDSDFIPLFKARRILFYIIFPLKAPLWFLFQLTRQCCIYQSILIPGSSVQQINYRLFSACDSGHQRTFIRKLVQGYTAHHRCIATQGH